MRRLDMLATKLVGGGNITVTRESNADNIPPTAAPNANQGVVNNTIPAIDNTTLASAELEKDVETHLSDLSKIEDAESKTADFTGAIDNMLTSNSTITGNDVKAAHEFGETIAASIGDTAQHEAFKIARESGNDDLDAFASEHLCFAREGLVNYAIKLGDDASNGIKNAVTKAGAFFAAAEKDWPAQVSLLGKLYNEEILADITKFWGSGYDFLKGDPNHTSNAIIERYSKAISGFCVARNLTSTDGIITTIEDGVEVEIVISAVTKLAAYIKGVSKEELLSPDVLANGAKELIKNIKPAIIPAAIMKRLADDTTGFKQDEEHATAIIIKTHADKITIGIIWPATMGENNKFIPYTRELTVKQSVVSAMTSTLTGPVDIKSTVKFMEELTVACTKNSEYVKRYDANIVKLNEAITDMGAVSKRLTSDEYISGPRALIKYANTMTRLGINTATGNVSGRLNIIRATISHVGNLYSDIAARKREIQK